MRPFDFKESWLDDERKPLAGRVSFCKLHTTVLENIYDNQGYPCNNPMFTNTIGQLDSQVFLKDNTDYTVRFEKYVGNGDMTEDQDNWLFQYSCDVLWNVYGIDIAGDAFQVASTISELRATDPDTVKDRDGRKVILLGGYNAVGDKPTVMYIWNPYSIASDNGGSTIKVGSVNTGRWELVNLFDESGVDVRHFGVFGADSASDATDAMSLAIGIASTYASSINRPLYFPSNQGYTWYKINNLNISGALFAKDTRVFGNTGTESRITVRDQDTYLDVYTNVNYLGRFTITGGTVRTSWGVNSTNCVFDPELRLIIDSTVNTSNKAWTGIIVDALEHIDHASFDNCQLNAVGTVGNYCSFQNMRVTEAMFEQGVNLNTITVFDNDIIDLSDFPTTSTWFSLVLENSGRVFDFQGRDVDSSCENNTTSDIYYRNANFNGYVVKQSGVTFENCTGTVETTAAVQNVAVKNCTMAMTGTASVMQGFAAVDSTVAFGRNMTFNEVSLNRSILNDENVTHFASLFSLTDSQIKSALSCTTLNAIGTSFHANIAVVTPTFLKCDFYGGTVSQNNVSGSSIYFVFRQCNFYGGNGHHFASSVANTLVVGEWSGNYSALSGQFVTFDRTNIDPDEQHHTYIYDGNTGPHTLQRLAAKWKDVVYTGPSYPGTGDAQGVLQNKTMYFNGWQIGGGTAETNINAARGWGYRGRMARNDENGGGKTLIDYYLTEFQMFSIGTQNIGVLAMTGTLPSHVTQEMAITDQSVYGMPMDIRTAGTWAPIDEEERLWYSSQVGTPRNIMFKGGYTWRITCVIGLGLIGFSQMFPGSLDWELPVTYEIKPA